MLQTRAGRDGLIAILVGGALYGLFLYIDIYDSFHEFMLQHEDWELDELITALLVVGVVGFIYGWRRHQDLRAEMRRRDRAEQTAVWYAFHDPLTQLFNRHYADENVVGELGRTVGEMPNTIFALDLDDFRGINDLIGQNGGDKLLQIVADRLRNLFPGDEIIRLGGDEFLVLSQIPFDGALEETVTDTIRRLGEPMLIGSVQVAIGASVGICNPREHATNMGDAIQCAELALNDAKQHGRNSIRVFDPALQEEVSKRIALEHALREAIRTDSIVPYYQPLITLGTGVLHGFETLARWTDESGAPIPPTVFIGIAEEAGLIADLSDNLLRRACIDALAWPKEARLAFNISPLQLTDRTLGARILQILHETGFPPDRFEVEITESALVQELAVAGEVIDELRNASVQIVLDDFGTGYSSLSQLSNIPFDEIKIDRSFVSSFETDERQMNVIKAIVGLSHGLGVVTTAEGIEELSQSENLKRLGCDFGQGYLFGKPMPASEVAGYLASSPWKRFE
ncbi:putative bifunctional diguanylate cyclase/phosphodiesterase [Amorphus sp. 3PC139-8]|uniref:putative bifunctional diguanylate cyclase/phosphodiesterase n=1 Tax=Amorphus sp. 3PC139-8 TaxID=2735676 RepID=UPI00345CAC3C